MGYLGNIPTAVPIQSSDLADGIVTNAKLGTDISAAKLTAGTLADARFPATLPAISGANLTGISGGKINQVVTANIGSSDVTTTSTSYSDLATINITPSATSSSIYIIVSGNYNLFGNNSVAQPQGYLTIRNASDSDLTRAQAYAEYRNDSIQKESGINISYYVSPSSTSQQTYKLSFRNTVSGGRFRMLHNPTRITAMEVLA